MLTSDPLTVHLHNWFQRYVEPGTRLCYVHFAAIPYLKENWHWPHIRPRELNAWTWAALLQSETLWFDFFTMSTVRCFSLFFVFPWFATVSKCCLKESLGLCTQNKDVFTAIRFVSVLSGFYAIRSGNVVLWSCSMKKNILLRNIPVKAQWQIQYQRGS